MSYMPRERLVQEWGRSVAILSDLLGERVTAASVPSGYYSRQVAGLSRCAKKGAADATGVPVSFSSLFFSRPLHQAAHLLAFGNLLLNLLDECK